MEIDCCDGQLKNDIPLEYFVAFLRVFFVVLAELATSLLVLDGFDQHFQATVHTSKQGRRLTQQHQSYFSKNNSKLSRKKLWEHWDSNPGRLGGKRERYLCAMPTPHKKLDSFAIKNILWNPNDLALYLGPILPPVADGSPSLGMLRHL